MRLNGNAKAAVFLLSLDEVRAAKIIEQLDERELRQLREAVEALGPVSSEILEDVFVDFSRDFKKGVTSMQGGTDYLRDLVRKVRGEAQATRIFANGPLPLLEGQKPFANLADADPDVLRVAISEEHPQVAAAVLGHLTPTLAAQIVQGLSQPQQTDILLRIAMLKAIPQDAFADAEQALGGLALAAAGGEGEIDGMTSVATILNELPSTSATELLERIAEQHPEEAAKIQRAMFSFEHLVDADSRGLQQLLREVQSDTLLVALRTASAELKEKILACMSSRAATMLLEEMEMMPPVRLIDVENAQQQIIEIAMRLIGEGKMSVKGRGEELL
jgi:flagellar motor switch protein FliG